MLDKSTYKTLASFLLHISCSYIWLPVHTWMGLGPKPIPHSQAASALTLGPKYTSSLPIESGFSGKYLSIWVSTESGSLCMHSMSSTHIRENV